MKNDPKPLAVSDLKPGDMIYFEPDLGNVDYENPEFDTGAVVVRRQGKLGYVNLDSEHSHPDLYAIKTDGSYEAMTTYWVYFMSLERMGSRYYRTQAEAIRAAVASDREYHGESLRNCEIAERVADELEKLS